MLKEDKAFQKYLLFLLKFIPGVFFFPGRLLSCELLLCKKNTLQSTKHFARGKRRFELSVLSLAGRENSLDIWIPALKK